MLVDDVATDKRLLLCNVVCDDKGDASIPFIDPGCELGSDISFDYK